MIQHFSKIPPPLPPLIVVSNFRQGEDREDTSNKCFFLVVELLKGGDLKEEEMFPHQSKNGLKNNNMKN